MKEFRVSPGIDYALENSKNPDVAKANSSLSTGSPTKELHLANFSSLAVLQHQQPGKNILPAGETLLRNGFNSFVRQDKNLPVVETETKDQPEKPDLLRLFVKNGEYIYARPADIVMIESCDHLVKIHLAIDTNVKKAVRNNTLKDFLKLLPQDQFKRIGRFCAINIARLSGGNCKEQTFEFDFKVSVKLKRAISQSCFATIGR